MEKELKSVTMAYGVCPICGGPISEDWAGKNPCLGTTCRNCADKSSNIFAPENIEFCYQRYNKNNPFRGTKVMVNGQIGTIISTQGNCSWVSFPEVDGKFAGIPRTEHTHPDLISSSELVIKGLGYWNLYDIHMASFSTKPTIPAA
jgi:hypothetical protein